MSGASPNLLEAALDYHARGFSVFPVTKKEDGQFKKPAVKWKHLQKRQPTPEELRSMFKRPNLTGLAVALGPASGNVYMRDFDDMAAYQRWADAHQELAKTLPAAMGKRGPHVYFRSEHVLRTKDYGDGELRGLGGYAILPPSLHHTGHQYTWQIPISDGGVPVCDPVAGGLCRSWGCTEQTERTEKTESTEEARAHTANTDNTASVGSVLSVPLNESEMDALIAAALPTNEHQSNKRLFRLARGVKALEKVRGAVFPQPELHAILDAWYGQAVRFLREDQSRDEYWFEFLYGYDRVKYPFGEGVVAQAWDRAQKSLPPKIAEQFENPQTRLLVKLCRELQRGAGNAPFYLSCRTVAGLFHHATHTTGARWLYGMCRTKIIEEIEKGGPNTNKASRYKYLHPLDEENPK